MSVGNCKGSKGGTTDITARASRAISFTQVHVNEAAVRSPLLLRAAYVQQMGFLDEMHFLLGGDDHDLASRARSSYGWLMGYVLIDVYDDRSTSE